MIGASGLVGAALLAHLGASAVGTYRTRVRHGLRYLDAADEIAVGALLSEVRPSVIYFPAAQPDVEWCETFPEEAQRQNLGPLRATLAAAAGIPVVAYSTDYVFDGIAGEYGEDDPPAPINEYGRIKRELERLVRAAGGTVVRTTGVFGSESEPPKNFVLRLIASLRHGDRVRAPSDQLANPTWAPDLAAASVAIARTGEVGVWHVTGPEALSRDAFARLVAAVFELDPSLIEAVATSQLGQVAPRPLHTSLRRDRYRARFGEEPVRPPREGLLALRARM